MNGDAVLDTWFLRSGGYRDSEVDELLRRIAAELDAGRLALPLIESARFRWGSGGYAVEAVDWFLEQIFSKAHTGPGRTGAGPWRDPGDVTQLVLGGVSDLAQRYPPPDKPTPGKARKWFTGQCENAWRDFSQQSGIQLRCEEVQTAGKAWELRGVDQQIPASPDFGGPIRTRFNSWREYETISAGERRFTFQKMDRARSSSPVIAEIAARTARDQAGHFTEPARGRQRPPGVRGLVDEAGTPILYISGWHSVTSLCVSFPDRRWLRFLVRGTELTNAIMTAVDQSGNKVARYRINGEGRFAGLMATQRPEGLEITVNPDQQLTGELALALAIPTTRLLTSYFTPSS